MIPRVSILVLVLSLVISCEPVEESPAQEASENLRIPSQESWNPTIRINSVGKETVQARAAYSAHYDDPKEIIFIGKVRLDFFNQDGEHSSIMSADTGRIDDSNHLFTATGNVYVESDSGAILTTSILHWNENRESIYTDQAIILTTLTDTLYGVGFESDANLENWTIRQPTGVSYREFDNE